MVHQQKLERLTETLRDNLADLRRYAGEMAPGRLQRDRDLEHKVLHALYVVTQATIDSGNHVLADQRLPRADTYAAIFDRLREAGLVDADLGEALADWASLRNVLAHFYAVIDLDKIEQAVKQDLGAFDGWLATLDGLLRSDEGKRA